MGLLPPKLKSPSDITYASQKMRKNEEMSEKIVVKTAKNRGKKTVLATATILMLTFAALLSTIPTGSAAVRQEQTWAFVSLAPNPIGVDQSVHVRLFLQPFPPTATEFFHGFRYTITKPDGTTLV